jgi:hypothetical protein
MVLSLKIPAKAGQGGGAYPFPTKKRATPSGDAG